MVIKPEYLKTQDKVVSREKSGFFAGFARFFGFGGYEDVTIKETVVDLAALWKQHKPALLSQISPVIREAVSSVQEYAREMTETYIKQLDEVFKPELARLTQELLELAQDNEKREAEIKRA